MGAFVKKGRSVDVKFFVKKKIDKMGVINPEKFEILPAFEKEKYEECHVFLRPLNWGEACDLQRGANVVDASLNQRVFDPDTYIQNKLLLIILDWEFTQEGEDEDEIEKIPVTLESINLLHPMVADFLLKEYTNRFELSEEERKNS